jgi:hypothetical protein
VATPSLEEQLNGVDLSRVLDEYEKEIKRRGVGEDGNVPPLEADAGAPLSGEESQLKEEEEWGSEGSQEKKGQNDQDEISGSKSRSRRNSGVKRGDIPRRDVTGSRRTPSQRRPKRPGDTAAAAVALATIQYHKQQREEQQEQRQLLPHGVSSPSQQKRLLASEVEYLDLEHADLESPW